MLKTLLQSKCIIRSFSTQFGEQNVVGDLLKIQKSKIQAFESSLPKEYTKFLAQCREGHFLYTEKIHTLFQSLSLDTETHKRILITGNCLCIILTLL